MQSKSIILSLVCVVLVGMLVLAGWRVLALSSAEQQVPARATDAISGATVSMSTAARVIPENPHYEVLGNVEGLKGVVIRYDEQLYRGGDIMSKQGMECLKEQGIQTIIAVTPTPQQRSWADAAGIGYREISFEYDEVPNDLQVVMETIFRTSPGPFYVHCHGGVTRAGALCMLYRMRVQSWSFERSLIEFGRLGGNLSKAHDLTASVRVGHPEPKMTKVGEGEHDD